ncbi:MAG: hypothetical protein LUO79_08175 [Methanomassiliicoccales archaeon]|nr:hypothetical protein [Methanomassiliicoccales archaeon]
MLFRRGDRDDESTTSLLKSGVYRLSDLGEDEELKRFKGTSKAYSFWGAVKYTTVLTILLWWLPIFGQMIAGYVGGRRAGSPWRAVLAALIPVAFIFVILLCFDTGVLPSVIGGINIDPRTALSSASTDASVVSPYLTFALLYIKSFMGAVMSVTLLSINTYIVTLAFAYIGGVMAQQTRRELEWVSDHSGNRTNIMVGRDMEPDRAPLKSRALRRTPRAQVEEAGFESMQSLEGAAEIDGGEDDLPIRTTRRQALETTDEDARSRRAINDRVKAMERQQKQLEKRTKRSPAAGLVARSGMKPKARSAPKDADATEGNDYQYI